MWGLVFYFLITSDNIFNRFLLNFWPKQLVRNSESLFGLLCDGVFYDNILKNPAKKFFLQFFKKILFYLAYLLFYFSFSSYLSIPNYSYIKSYISYFFYTPLNSNFSKYSLSNLNFFDKFLFFSKNKETFEKITLRFFLFNSLNNNKIFHKNIIFYYVFSLFSCSNLILQHNYFFLVLQDARLKFRVKQINNKYIYKSNNSFNTKFMLDSFLIGLKYFWLGVRLWLLPLYVFFVCFFCMFLNKITPTYKIFFIIFILSSFFYWLLSGFTFFVKKYQYRYFTSAIQRFWKRTFALF